MPLEWKNKMWNLKYLYYGINNVDLIIVATPRILLFLYLFLSTYFL